jgi:predicted DNA-binding transcriptional regulator AlpA
MITFDLGSSTSWSESPSAQILGSFPLSNQVPLLVRSSTAAKMLDMQTSDFRRLVESGALPPPIQIGGHERWRVSQIEAVLRGDSALPSDGFDL